MRIVITACPCPPRTDGIYGKLGSILAGSDTDKTLVPDSKDLIRLGPNGDGGYLVPDDLTGIEACFSPGVCATSEFENTVLV